MPYPAAEELQSRGVAAGPVNTTPEMTLDEQVVSREFFVPFERFDTPMPGNPLHMTGVQSSMWTPCPALGEHNKEILGEWLGMSEKEVERLQADGILHDMPPG